MAASASIALPARARTSLRVLRRRAVLVCLGAVLLAAAYAFWFRDSSLVAVEKVRIEGLSRYDVELARDLRKAGLGMTTLHVDQAALAEAASGYPIAQSVSANPTLPSTLEIAVDERHPAALSADEEEPVAVAADGTILRGVPAAKLKLPRLPIAQLPRKPRLEGPLLEQARVLAAVPPPLRRHVERSFAEGGLVRVLLAGGVVLKFGDAIRVKEKWAAAAAVLADPELGPLDYVDLSVPRRPAVGGVGHTPPAGATG